MAEDITSTTVAENSTNGFSRDETRATVPLTRRRKAAKQVDSAGYKGDDEDDDYRMSVRRDAEESDRPPRSAKSKEQHSVEAFAAAFMCKDDLVFIQTLSKGMRRQQKPIQTPETASRGRIDISATFGACGSSEKSASTPDSVGDVQNTGATHRPSDVLSPNPMSSRNARDQNPTYNQDTLNPNTCNSNPMYPQSTPMHPELACDSDQDKHFNPTSSENTRDANEDTKNCTSQHPKQTCKQNAQRQQMNVHTEPSTDVDNPSIQGVATGNHEDDEAASNPAAGDGDSTCQPYAVRYREEDDPVDITPYAVAYMGQDEQTDTNTDTPSSSRDDSGVSVFALQAPAQSWLNPNPMYQQNALNPNPMYAQNTGNPNPPVPNAGQEADCVCTSSWVCTALTIAIVLVLLIVGGAFVGMYLSTSEQDSQTPTKSVDTDRIPGHHAVDSPSTAGQPDMDSPSTPGHPDMDSPSTPGHPDMDSPSTPGHPAVDSPSTPGHPAVDSPSTPGQPDCCISDERTTMADFLSKPTVHSADGQTTTIVSTSPQGVVPPSTSVSSQDDYVNLKPIVFGGGGTSRGKLGSSSGVAVSADNEIFVAEWSNQRVQVFNMNGVSLRLFKTVVPGEDGRAMYPTGLDIDKDGRIWVVGKKLFAGGAVQVVQYSKYGLPVATFDVPREVWCPRISVNARDNSKIVLTPNEILMFKPNGSFAGSFGKQEGAQLQYATTDKDGNILVTDISRSLVHVYDHNGQYSFSFDTVRVSKGIPRGICTDPLGHIFVADSANVRVDMFTSRGEFVRTVVNVTNPRAVAVGPGEQLVVTDAVSVATIFPRQMVFPDE